MGAPPQNNAKSTPAQFRSKLGTYLTGVAIGFTFLGTVYYFKAQAVKRDQEQRAAAQEQQQQQQEAGSDQTGAHP
ncbi:MAG: hypothetical protein CMJ35_04360 [Phycisphaerae bacterium]|nr:hypothetical protein [Phycisphaerae bacterium]MBM90832.1 hypothetical protein [Phycisphaerae bacterium]